MLRYLRIAFSVTCGILCLLLIVFWVRSYWCTYGIKYRSAASTQLAAWVADGAFGLMWGKTVDDLVNPPAGWTGRTDSRDRPYPLEGPLIAQVFRGFDRPRPDEVQVPIWFFVLVAGALASAPWLPWRFSLRTLLIAMTLVAILLGAIVYAMR